MKQLLLFNLKRRQLNKIKIIIGILLFIGIGIICHIDMILQDSMDYTVYLDRNMSQYYQGFLKTESRVVYEMGNKDRDIVLSFEDGFHLTTKIELDEKTISQIEKDLKNVVGSVLANDNYESSEFYKMYKAIDLNVISNQTNINNSINLLELIIYILIINYGSTAALETVYEKSTGILDTLLNNITISEYINNKIILGILSPLIEIVYILLCFIINLAVRFLQDGCEGLLYFIEKNLMSGTESLNNFTFSYLFLMLLILSGIVIIQVVLLLLTSKFNNEEEATALHGLFYIVVFILYYLISLNLTIPALESGLISILSYCPVISILFMSCRYIVGMSGIIEILMATFINTATFILIIKRYQNVYKENILNN